MVATPLNLTQIEILKMFAFHQSEEDLQALKKVLVNYLFQRAVEEADRVWDERGYTEQTVEEWKKEHMRVKVKQFGNHKNSED
jgi:hypothetical protein